MAKKSKLLGSPTAGLVFAIMLLWVVAWYVFTYNPSGAYDAIEANQDFIDLGLTLSFLIIVLFPVFYGAAKLFKK